jgi:hypothetical protein
MNKINVALIKEGAFISVLIPLESIATLADMNPHECLYTIQDLYFKVTEETSGIQ